MDNNDVMDRKALLIYLQNLRDLEVAKHCLARKYDNDRKIYDQRVRRLKLEPDYWIHWAKPSGSSYKIRIASLAILAGCSTVTIICYLFLLSPKLLYTLDGRPIYSGGPSILTTIALLAVITFTVYFFFKIFLPARSDYKKELKAWQMHEDSIDYNNQAEEEHVLNEKREKAAYDDWLLSQTSVYEEENAKVVTLLSNFYGMNIIPSQYRNLAAICYIYDYLSTSQQSLTSALFSQQIDDGIRRIESRLNEIVDKLEEQVYETRCLQDEMHQNNQKIINQNSQMIDSLSHIEQDAQKAAMYAELGSNYSKANAFFSLATYLKK